MFLWAFLIGVVVDSIPVFAPPAWSILVILILKWGANPWGVIGFGVLGSTLGRYFLSLYIPKVSSRFLSLAENRNLEYVGKKLDRGFWETNLFVLAYTLTPLSTTTLFTAAGLGRMNPLFILPAFAVGKFLSDAVMIFAAQREAGNIAGFFQGGASPKSVVEAVLALAVVAGLLFVDWRTLIEKSKLEFRFRILKAR